MKTLWDGLDDDSTWEKLLSDESDKEKIKKKICEMNEQLVVNKRDIDVLQRLIITLVENEIITREQVIKAKKKANEFIRKDHPDF